MTVISSPVIVLVSVLAVMGCIVLAGMIYGLYDRVTADTDPLDYTNNE